MEIGPLQEDTIESFIDELWIPAQHAMASVSEHTLVDDIRRDGLVHRRSRLSDDESITYLAHRENGLVGYVSAEVRTPPPIFQQVRECHINELFVRKDARRHGIAAELLSTIEEWGRANDCQRLDLNIDAKNRPAIALYEAEDYDVKRYNMKKSIENEQF